ncbi:hypothetical protein BEN49_15930 [Hymenobacter coccineus]|uniref:Uncharacterized protein n=1 Tax=Hymenobacter coccineus TaxID=1908235 RepID=A0A1G1SR66_9BACT|nr:hypothetical protein BEN49_15930 [Hymenobacter coccineus]
MPLAALALLYSWPLGRWRGRPVALRDVPLLKVFLIAGVWSLITVGLPVLALHRPWAEAQGLLDQRFLLVLALAIVFDIRDYGRDRAAGTPARFRGCWGAGGSVAGAGAAGRGPGPGPVARRGPAGRAAARRAGRRRHRHGRRVAQRLLLRPHHDGVLLVQAAAYFIF